MYSGSLVACCSSWITITFLLLHVPYILQGASSIAPCSQGPGCSPLYAEAELTQRRLTLSPSSSPASVAPSAHWARATGCFSSSPLLQHVPAHAGSSRRSLPPLPHTCNLPLVGAV